jgi:hypothetical protein
MRRILPISAFTDLVGSGSSRSHFGAYLNRLPLAIAGLRHQSTIQYNAGVGNVAFNYITRPHPDAAAAGWTQAAAGAFTTANLRIWASLTTTTPFDGVLGFTHNWDGATTISAMCDVLYDAPDIFNRTLTGEVDLIRSSAAVDRLHLTALAHPAPVLNAAWDPTDGYYAPFDPNAIPQPIGGGPTHYPMWHTFAYAMNSSAATLLASNLVLRTQYPDLPTTTSVVHPVGLRGQYAQLVIKEAFNGTDATIPGGFVPADRTGFYAFELDGLLPNGKWVPTGALITLPFGWADLVPGGFPLPSGFGNQAGALSTSYAIQRWDQACVSAPVPVHSFTAIRARANRSNAGTYYDFGVEGAIPKIGVRLGVRLFA